MRRYLLAITACLICCCLARAEELLNLGDPAPPLVVASWLKGEKIEQFQPGKTYVVEFWATWCGPCRASIPHLTELAHKYKDQGVRVIGVDVWEQDTSKVQPFLDEMGDQMDYSVALDSVPPGGVADDGVMAKTWMAAAAEYGIPTAFVVNGGKIAWIGHPLEMDEPLAQIVAGKWNPQEKAAERLVVKTKEKKAMAAREKIFKPYREKDYKATLAAIGEVTSSDAELIGDFEPTRFAVLEKLGDVDAALALGKKLLDDKKDDAFALNGIAWAIAYADREQPPDGGLAQLALKAARRADELTKGEDYNLIDTLACALYWTGDYAGAVKAEEKALALLEEKVKDRSHPYVEQFTKRLERFRQEAKPQAPGR